MSLIYLVSSLPMLSFESASGPSDGAFLSACRDQLAPGDAAVAEALLAGRPLNHPFAEAWADKETILRNAVARQRARAQGTDPARWLRPTPGCDNSIETAVEDAFQEPSPLKRETALDKLRWTLADELAGPDPLHINALFAYAVKLAVLGHRRALDAARGAQIFESLTSLSPVPDPTPPNPEP